ncbi:hypothetical protein [Algoriphagus taiwanensis]|uniref:Glycosyltransferase RgtA/B/C/D-like domain-containing protein n=1 Tax=Algoriphagus taiwanensis TaxID=1445656 RepID=A0ABQ6Q294_9BACT|nr:hypothetical protein Ataiwa_25760 [Algoriphagus taiwanensis]
MPKLLPVSTLICLALILVGINRGFDVSDEGFYVLLAHPFQENQSGIFNYDLFFKLFYQFTGIHFGIVGLRILRLLSYGLGAFALAVFYRNVGSENQLSPKIFLLSLLGLFAGYGFLPASLSYNHLSVVLAAFWLALISSQGFVWKKCLCIGLLIALLVYVKVTTALLIGVLTLGIWVFEKRLNGKALLSLIIPFFALEVLFFSTLGQSAIFRLQEGLAVQTARADYHWWTLIKHTAVGGFWCLLVFGNAFLVFRMIKKPIFQALLVLPSFLLVFFLTRVTEEWNHFFLLSAAVVWALLFAQSRFSQLASQAQVWTLLLLVFPFVLHLGSNVYWLRIGIHYLVFWILAWLIWEKNQGLQVGKWVNYGLAGASLVWVFNGLWWHPFEQKELWKNTESWEYMPGKTILLTPDQLFSLEKLQTEVGEEEEVLAAYRISGIPFLLGKTLPKSPGFWDQEQLSYFFPKGDDGKVILYHPIQDLPDHFSNDHIIINSWE